LWHRLVEYDGEIERTYDSLTAPLYHTANCVVVVGFQWTIYVVLNPKNTVALMPRLLASAPMM